MPRKKKEEVVVPEIDDYIEKFAVSKIFARAKKQMNLKEWKTFAFALSAINLAACNDNKLSVDKQDLANAIGITSDSRHLSQNLKRAIGELPKHSYIQIDNKDKDFYESGVVITNLKMSKGIVTFTLNSEYMDLFTNCSSNYILMLSNDIYNMKTDKSPEFYEDLRLHADTRKTEKEPNSRLYTTKQLKDMFNLKDTDYMRAKGGFNRSAFEKKVLDAVCEDIVNSKLINLMMQQDSKGKCKFYEKVKKGNSVVGYRFYWTINDIDQLELEASKALGLPEPEVKVQENNTKKPETKNSFNSFPQRNYDYSELERMLLGGGKK